MKEPIKIEQINFPYATNVVSRQQFDEHQKLYAGYIGKMNEINDVLVNNPEAASANAIYSHYRGLKKGETFALNGIILHEEYFANLGGRRKGMGETTSGLLQEFFGSIEAWAADFAATAASARGWCITAYDQRQQTIINLLQDSHDDGVITMAFPIIVLDMYEHAYFIDYGANKAEYIKNFIENIDWDVVEGRAAKVAAIFSKV